MNPYPKYSNRIGHPPVLGIHYTAASATAVTEVT